MNNFNDRQKAIGVRSEIKSMIELAKNYASTMQYAKDAADVGVLPSYYKVGIAGNMGAVSVKYTNGDVGFFEEKNWAGEGVAIGDVTVCFKPFETVQYDCGVGTTAAKTIVVTSGGAAYSLIVDEYGKITEVNP
jgi:hypothetical protein